MRSFQKNRWAKACAALLLLLSALGTGIFGTRTVLSAGSVLDDSWQNSSRYYNLVERRRNDLVNGIYLVLRLDQLERQAKETELQDADYHAMLQADIEAVRQEIALEEERFGRTNTWFRFRVLSAGRQTVMGSNLEAEESMYQAVQTVHTYTITLALENVRLQDGSSEPAGPDLPTDQLVLEYGVPLEVNDSVRDEFFYAWELWDTGRLLFQDYFTGFACMGGLTLAALVWVLWSAGHTAGREEIVLSWQERIWFDLYAAVLFLLGLGLMAAAFWAAESLYWRSCSPYSAANESLTALFDLGVAGTGVLFAGGVGCAALLLRTLAVRLKAKALARTTLLCRVLAWTAGAAHRFALRLPVTWKALLAFAGYVMLSVLLFGVGGFEQSDILLLLFCMLQIAVAGFLAWWADSYRKLRLGTRTIAKGDLEFQINTRSMPYDLRLQAEDLNNISAGLSSAVDEKMKSERFKAELITNVSHDLKTPLTSIINYVSLLKHTQQTDPTAAEYIEVLDRKSQRLKKLTEDLVEASKASTGALSVSRERIDAGQLLDQALGEWEEKLEARQLSVVKNLPDGETWVYADGRHLWRVVDNLLSNCAKYAMEGTRVYLDLERKKGQVTVSIKNISREPLNLPPERLMERFVRGEESRSTEGSGLGLSIARSLTELQGGGFELMVDGDLFKAILTLPQAS